MSVEGAVADEGGRMRLYWSSRSPFVRKVMVVAHELNLVEQLATERVVAGVVRLNDAVMAANPLNKIPTLITREGDALFDSRVICEYLEALVDPGRLFPTDERRWPALRLQALADGMMELVTLRLFENARPEAARWEKVHEAAGTKLALACDLAETLAAADGPGAFHIGHIALACALSHYSFRFGEDAWRPRRPWLAGWYDTMRARPSMIATEYEDVY